MAFRTAAGKDDSESFLPHNDLGRLLEQYVNEYLDGGGKEGISGHGFTLNAQDRGDFLLVARWRVAPTAHPEHGHKPSDNGAYVSYHGSTTALGAVTKFLEEVINGEVTLYIDKYAPSGPKSKKLRST